MLSCNNSTSHLLLSLPKPLTRASMNGRTRERRSGRSNIVDYKSELMMTWSIHTDTDSPPVHAMLAAMKMWVNRNRVIMCRS